MIGPSCSSARRRPSATIVRRAALRWTLAIAGVVAALTGCQTSSTGTPATPPPTPSPASGSTPSSPGRLGEVVSTSAWDVLVTEATVGAAALERIPDLEESLSAKQASPQAIAIHLVIQHRPGFDTQPWRYAAHVLGEDGQLRTLTASPAALRETLDSGEAVDNWVGDLMETDALPVALAVSLQQGSAEAWAYFTLPGSPTWTAPEPIAPATRNTLGISPDAPAQIGETLVLDERAVTVEAVLWGTEFRPILPDLVPPDQAPSNLDRWAFLRVRVWALGAAQEPCPLPRDAFLYPADGVSGAASRDLIVPEAGLGDHGEYALPGVAVRYWTFLNLGSGGSSVIAYLDPPSGDAAAAERRYIELEP